MKVRNLFVLLTRQCFSYLLLGSMLAFTGCNSKTANVAAQSTATKPAAGTRTAPNFTLKDADGRNVSLADYRGKVVLLNFWATWCGPCKLEIPWFMEFQQKYKSEGLEVVGVSMDDEGWSVVKPFIAEQKMNYRVLLGNDTVGEQYGGIDSLPTTFIVDQNGQIAATHVGLVSKSDYEDDLKKLLPVQKSARANSNVPAGFVLPLR